MNIGFDAKRIFFNKGGIGNYGRNTVHHLCEYVKDLNYYLYTPSTNENQLFTPPEGCEVKMPPLLYRNMLVSYWRESGLKKNLYHDNIDVFHGLSNVLPNKINKTGIKSVVTIHDLIFLRFPQFYEASHIAQYKAHFARSTEMADMVIAVSKQTRDDLIEFFKISPQKIKVLYQSCHPSFYETRTSEEKKQVKEKYKLPSNFILNVGTIEARKNLLSILRTLNDKRIDVPLVVVGQHTDYEDQAQQYIAEHNMESRVILLHSVDDFELSCIYQLAKLSIYPSFYEGFGIPVIESLASGTPVITSKGTCLKEAGGPDSLYVNPGSTEEISDAIEKLLFDTNERERIIKSGLEFVEKFRGEHAAGKLKKVYQSLI